MRLFCRRRATVVPDPKHPNCSKEDYNRLVAIMDEYAIFMDKTYPRISESKKIRLKHIEYKTRLTYITDFQEMYDRLEMYYLYQLHHSEKYYTRAKIKLKPVFDDINAVFYDSILKAHSQGKLIVEESLLYEPLLMTLFKESGPPPLVKHVSINVD